MKLETVDWKRGISSKGIDAEKAFNALETIREKNGGLTDDAIVNAAKPKNHVLHKWFEWDDSKAANEHRRNQARLLIRSFEVTYQEQPELKTRAYEVAKKAPRNAELRTVYTTTQEVLDDPESRDRLIAEAVRMAMEFRRRFRMLSELERVMSEIDSVIEELGAATV